MEQHRRAAFEAAAPGTTREGSAAEPSTTTAPAGLLHFLSRLVLALAAVYVASTWRASDSGTCSAQVLQKTTTHSTGVPPSPVAVDASAFSEWEGIGAVSAPCEEPDPSSYSPSTSTTSFDFSKIACKHEPMTIGGAGVPSPKAYIISVNAARYNRTRTLLSRMGFHPIHVRPPSPDSCAVILDGRFYAKPEMNQFRKTHSNKLAQLAIWKHIANDPDLPAREAGDGSTAAASPPPYSLVFEDDVALADGIDSAEVLDITNTAAAMAADAGVFYLGMCGPDCAPDSEVTRGKVQFARCVGRCAHAYGIHKHRAAFLYEELSAVTPPEAVADKYFYYGDVFLHYGSQYMPSSAWPVLAGSRSTLAGAVEGHVGIFIQDRVSLPSEILPGS